MEQLVGVFIIGHEKTKKTKNRDGFEYDFTTFNVLGKTSDIIEREADIIIYGDMVTVEGEEKGVSTERRLMFRSDGNILCGSRFRNFPDYIENDVTVFIETFKNAVLGLYDGDKKAVEKAIIEQKEHSEKKSKAMAEAREEADNAEKLIEEVKGQIGALVKDMQKTDKLELAKYYKEHLGGSDYRVSNDLDALKDALAKTKEVAGV